MFTLRRFAPLAIALLVGVGCASDVETGVSYDPLTRFPRLARFAWDERANKLPRDPRIQQLNLDPIIKRTVAAEMGARGYRQVTSGNPDYLLSYQIGVNTWHGAGGSLSVGSLSLQMNEANGGRRVWVGFVRANVEVGLSDAERETRFRKMFRKVLEDFPPSGR